MTIKNLKKCGLITNHRVMAWNSIVIDPAYVHISSDKNNGINDYLKELEENRIFCIGRYGRWTYCSMEDCCKQALERAVLMNE